MNEINSLGQERMKRNVAFKVRIGQIFSGSKVFEGERLKGIEISGNKVMRVNIIANIVDKYVQEGEKKFASLTLDDATGQIKVKYFGEDVEKTKNFEQGDTVLAVGLLRAWNNEVYLTSEILKKKDPRFLLVRKLEVENSMPKILDRTQVAELKDKVISMIKEAEQGGGVEIEKMILELKEPPEAINSEIKRLLEEGTIYEPRPGKLRYLG